MNNYELKNEIHEGVEVAFLNAEGLHVELQDLVDDLSEKYGMNLDKNETLVGTLLFHALTAITGELERMIDNSENK